MSMFACFLEKKANYNLMETASPMILFDNHFLAALFGLETHACVHVDVCLFSLENKQIMS